MKKRVFNIIVRETGYTIREEMKRQLHTLQDKKVQKTITNAQECFDFLMNHLEHLKGNHKNCLSKKCKEKHKKGIREDFQTAVFCEQVDMFKKAYLKKKDCLTPYICEGIRHAKYTSEVESFNRFLLIYCPKLIKFHKSHVARIYCAICDWNAQKGSLLFKDWRKKLMQKYGLM